MLQDVHKKSVARMNQDVVIASVPVSNQGTARQGQSLFVYTHCIKVMEENINEIKDSFLARLYENPSIQTRIFNVLDKVDTLTIRKIAQDLAEKGLIEMVAGSIVICRITEKGIIFCENESFSNPNKSILQMINEAKKENPDII